MKIILSKKGWDTMFGGLPSPIIGGAITSLPIPEKGNGARFSDLVISSHETICDVVKRHYPKVFEKIGDAECHADPNLVNYFGAENFLGSVGQVDSAFGHLKNQGVKVGDLFIFYGLFQEWREPNSKPKHSIFGYLQVGEILNVTAETKDAAVKKYPFLATNPHCTVEKYLTNKTNTVYVARENLTFAPDIKGFGTFKYSPALDLTKPNAETQREWQVSDLGGLLISWNGGRKFDTDGKIEVTKGYGQEFVLGESPAAEKWAQNLIKTHAKNGCPLGNKGV